MSEVKVLDGGFATQLAFHVGEKIDGDPLWSARFVSTNPDAVTATHLDFLRVGSDIIGTNSYQASIDGFIKYLQISAEESTKLFYKAVDCARNAVNIYLEEIKDKTDVANKKPLIAGSCGPYGASLHDSSEYTGWYGIEVSTEFLMDWHRPRVKALLDAGVDLLALETIPCKQEANALVQLLKEFPNSKAWLSFSCASDGKSLADGSNFQEIAIKCYKEAQPGQLLGIGVNCIAPQLVTPLLKGINNEKSTEVIPLVAYPNSGEKYTVTDGWKKENECPALYQFIEEWLDLGLRYIGGCCRIKAEDIKSIRSEIDRLKKK